MTQPNFLQVQNSLDRSVEFATGHPDLDSSALYGARLHVMRTQFEEARDQTDQLFTSWRFSTGREMKQFRDLRLEWDVVAALADEHAYDDFPARKIVYTEYDHLVALVKETIAWLQAKGSEWAWLDDKATRLGQMMVQAEQLEKESGALYDQYTGVVRRRVAAYADAVALLREYIGEVRREVGPGPELTQMSLDVR